MRVDSHNPLLLQGRVALCGELIPFGRVCRIVPGRHAHGATGGGAEPGENGRERGSGGGTIEPGKGGRGDNDFDSIVRDAILERTTRELQQNEMGNLSPSLVLCVF